MRGRRFAALVLTAALATAAAVGVRAAEGMTSATNEIPRSVAGGAGGLDGAASANHRLEAAFGEEIGGSSVASASHRLAPGFAQLFSFPGTVVDLSAGADVSVSSVTLAWSTPGLDGALGILQDGSSYYLRVASDAQPGTLDDFALADIVISTRGEAVGTAVSSGAVALLANTTYWARIWTKDQAGGLSYASQISTFVTLAREPAAVADPFLHVDATSMTVSWSANGNQVGVTTYTVVLTSGAIYPNALSDNVVFDTAPTGAFPAALPAGLSGDTTYYLFVRAVNHSGVATDFVSFGSTVTQVHPKTWIGGSGASWNTAANWSPAGVPARGDAVTIAIAASVEAPAAGPEISFSSLTLGVPSGATAVALTLSTTIASGGSVLIYPSAGLTQATTRQLVFDGDFTMVSGSSLSHTSENATSISSVNVRVTGLFDLQAGATINVTGRGYRGGGVDQAGFGPGGGGNNIANNKGGGGAGYANAGGAGATAPAGAAGTAYGSASAPVDMGSGGGGAGNTGLGGAGGGVVIIEAARMTLDGVILSSGAAGDTTAANNPAAGGGGSGGGVFLTAGTFTGTGTIDVSGGPGGGDLNGGDGGGGSGGRAAVVIQNSGTTCNLTVLANAGAAGGGTAAAGGVGSLFTNETLAAPGGFGGAPQSASSILWIWNLTTGATDYQLFSSTGGPMSPPLGAAASYTTTGLEPNTTASFYVQARACGANTVDAAPEPVATLAAAPAALASPAFPSVGQSSMSVAWGGNGNPVDVTTYSVVLSKVSPYPNAEPGNVELSTYPAGASLAATPAALDPNSTYYLFVAARNHAGLMTSYVDLSTAASTLASPVALLAESFQNVTFSSAAAKWAAFPTALQDVSSMTAEGYLVEASSTNFGILTPGGAIYSSMTPNVALSTLTVAIVPAPAHLCVDHYFRVASLNWSSARTYTVLGSTRAPDDYAVLVSTQDLDVGGMNLAAEVVISTSLLISNTGCPVTYQLKVEALTPGTPWTVAASPAQDAFTVSARFNSLIPAAGDFAAGDALTTTPVSSTVSKFAGDQNGAGVPVTEDRLLWFKLAMPTTTSTADPQQIRVTVYAVPP